MMASRGVGGAAGDGGCASAAATTAAIGADRGTDDSATKGGDVRVTVMPNVVVQMAGQGIRGLLRITQPAAYLPLQDDTCFEWLPYSKSASLQTPTEPDTFADISLNSVATTGPATDLAIAISALLETVSLPPIPPWFASQPDPPNQPVTKFLLCDIYSAKRYRPRKGNSVSHVTFALKNGLITPTFFLFSGGLKELFLVLRDSLRSAEEDPNVFVIDDNNDIWAKTCKELPMFGMDAALLAPSVVDDPSRGSISPQGIPDIAELPWKVFESLGIWAKPGVKTAVVMPTKMGDFEVIESPSAANKATELQSKPIPCPVNEELPEVMRCSPLNAMEWIESFDNDGRMPEKKKMDICQRIFSGGVSADIRQEVWKYLLSFYPWNSTNEERRALHTTKRLQYFAIKSQWTSMGPEQEARCSKFRLRKQQIERDVLRTDRTYPYYQGDTNLHHVNMLFEILLTYSHFNSDCGYMQGMNDLCSVILEVMDGDEVATFWCFKGLMDRMEMNFHKDQPAIREQLDAIRDILEVIDPRLFSHLKSSGSESLYFCYRWLLVLFKREFSFDTVKHIWETIWSHSSPTFQLFIALAILTQHRDQLMQADMKYDEILQFINGLAGKLSADKVLAQAESLFFTYLRMGSPKQKEYIWGLSQLCAQPLYKLTQNST
ncbi:TBC1 domain family member 17 [Pelomyxa schiedti]|nr:TBC1 domain family member 17 [Pelomyxa schiedti]